MELDGRDSAERYQPTSPCRPPRRKRANVLLWDGTGLCIYAKRLEQGRFACLWRDAAARAVRLTMSELQLFLEGSALVGRIALSPAPFVVGERAKNLVARAAR
jgi:transposase